MRLKHTERKSSKVMSSNDSSVSTATNSSPDPVALSLEELARWEEFDRMVQSQAQAEEWTQLPELQSVKVEPSDSDNSEQLNQRIDSEIRQPSEFEKQNLESANLTVEPAEIQGNLTEPPQEEFPQTLHVSEPLQEEAQGHKRKRTDIAMKGGKFKCPYCPYTSYNKATITQHHIILKHTPSDQIKWLKCKHCNFKAKTALTLCNHTKKHEKKWHYECSDCSATFPGPRLLKNHVQDKHRDDDPDLNIFECKKCLFKTSSTSLLNAHKKICLRESDSCQSQNNTNVDIAFEVGTNQNTGITAMETPVIVTETPVVMETDACTPTSLQDETISSSTPLAAGSARKLIPIKSKDGYKCPVCPYTSPKKICLTAHHFVYAHVPKESVKLLTCKYCEYRATTVMFLSQHVSDSHKDKEPLECPFCPSVFPVLKRMYRHVVHEHAEQMKVDHSVVKCDSCHCKATQAQMKTHKLTCPGLKTNEDQLIKCDSCAFTGKMMAQLNMHKRFCKGAPKNDVLKCDLCPFTAQMRAQLNMHMKHCPSLVQQLTVESVGNETTTITDEKKTVETHSPAVPRQMTPQLTTNETVTVVNNVDTSKMTAQQMMNELTSEGNNNNLIKCPICGSLETDKFRFLAHFMFKHMTEQTNSDNNVSQNFSCAYCPYQGQTREGWLMHMNNAHQANDLPQETHQANDLSQAKNIQKAHQADDLSQAKNIQKAHQVADLHEAKHIQKTHANDLLQVKNINTAHKADLTEFKNIHQTLEDNSLPEVKNTQLACAKCEYICTDAQSMRKHVESKHTASNTVTLKSDLVCDVCGYQGKSLRGLRVHTTNAHRPGGKCKKCGLEIENFVPFRIHRKTCNGNTSNDSSPKKCKLCKFISADAQSLRKHIQSKHIMFSQSHAVNVKTTNFLCQICSFKAKSLRGLRRHTLFSHRDRNLTNVTDTAIVKCESKTVAQMNMHKKVCHRQITENSSVLNISAQKCKYCPFMCADKQNMRLHVKSKHIKFSQSHNNVKSSFLCQLCNVRFTSLKGLRIHMTNTHKDQDLTNVDDVTKVKCDNCAYVTKTVVDLKKHMSRCQRISSHRSTKKICTYCKYTCFDQQHLLQHIKVKHKRDVCPTCDFNAKSPHGLIMHMKMHESRPFKCAECSYASNTEALLKWHKKKRHQADDASNKCNLCSFRGDAAALSYHVNSHAGVNKCPHCNYVTLSTNRMSNHVISKHTPDSHIDWFKCKFCEFKSKVAFGLTVHVRTHAPVKVSKKGVSCNYCAYTSQSRYSVQKHMRAAHQSVISVLMKQKNDRDKVEGQKYVINKKKVDDKTQKVDEVKNDKIQSFESELLANLTSINKDEGDSLRVESPFKIKKVESLAKVLKVASHKCELCSFVGDSTEAVGNHVKYWHDCGEILTCDMCLFRTKILGKMDEHREECRDVSLLWLID